MIPTAQAPAQFYRKRQADDRGREIRAIGNPKTATAFELFADVFIPPGTMHNKWITTTGTLFIVPLFGAIECNVDTDETFIHINQVAQVSVKAGTKLRFKNVYPDHSVRFLLFLIKSDSAVPFQIQDYTLEAINKLHNLDVQASAAVHLGQFEGREETVYHYKKENTSVFAYVLQGAFEFQNRLVETGEGICLWDQQAIALEALANNAYLVLIEF